MKILDRYIAKDVIQAILIVNLALLGIDLFFYFVNELRYVGRGNYHLPQAFLFLALKIPTKLYFLLPWASLIGSLLALGFLAKDQELTVMQTAGVSVIRISVAVVKSVCWLLVFMLLIGEGIAPFTEDWAQQNKLMAVSQGQAMHAKKGLWMRYHKNFVYVDEISKDGCLHDIFMFSFQGRRLEKMSFIKMAYHSQSGWILKDMVSTKIDKQQINQIQIKKQITDDFLDVNILDASNVTHLERLSFWRLFNLMKHRQQHEMNVHEYQLAFWNKVFHPLSILIMVWLAIPFIFGPLRQTSIGIKIVSGIFIGLFFYLFNMLFTPLTVIVEMPPFLAAGFPTIFFAVIGIFYNHWQISRTE